MRIMIPGVAIVVALTGLVAMGVLTMAIPELQVHQVLAGEFPAREVKVQGVIQAIASDVRPLCFQIRDREKPSELLWVEIDDVRPDIFKVDNDVAVIGTFDALRGRLYGDKVFTKCPSKYEATEQAVEAYESTEAGSPGSARSAVAGEGGTR